ncbi:hypothetical protein DRE_06516 [Drechslerella stenobrocha 248]|uniref:NmrA-like domain-containing protein n=1 Tax=Drechslerella stenobrocha 248 TaxID=1043628 RepID=W7HXT8_9PEZI|nr:hypothetical protein DRE_06516 [Drechslerella stenobrocha 248]
MSAQNVLVLGGSGNLGGPILAAIAADPSFNVTVLTREGSKSTFPAGVPVKRADYTSHDSLVAAFKGHDTIVSVVATDRAIDQIKFVDAAVEAGVRRFYPTEFGSIASSDDEALVREWWDRTNIHGKFEVYQHIKKLADAGKIEYTLIANGPFFDWGLLAGFLGLDPKERKATVLGSGNQIVAVSTLAHVGKGVVWSLSHQDETKNRAVRLYSHKITQNQLVEAAESATGTKWTVERVPVQEWIQKGEEALKGGSPWAGYQVMQGFIFDEEDKYGSNFKVNEFPAEEGRTVEQVVKDVLGSL